MVLPRHAAQHLFAAAILADRERRRGEVDDRVGAGAHQLFDRIVVIAAALPEVAIVPNILADTDAEPASAELEDLRAVVGLEVPVLVEYVVRGQQRFPKPLSDDALVQQHRGIEERPSRVGGIRLRQSDEYRRLIGEIACKSRGGVPAASDEGSAEQEIARKVPDERELWRDGEIRALAAGLARRLCNQPGVPGEVADERIDLQERDFHGVYGRSHFSLT